jgi:inactivated superfamily I helicase
MGDVDLFALAREGEALTVNSKWLQHLEDRLLGEDGHPRKAREGEDPHR